MLITAHETFERYFPMLLIDNTPDNLMTFPKQALINIAHAYGWKNNNASKASHRQLAEYIHASILSGKSVNTQWVDLRLTREARKQPKHYAHYKKCCAVV